MQTIQTNPASAAAQLACDEALLLAADEGIVGPTLRVWEFDRPVVILGRSSRVEFEVDEQYCQQHAIPILRRCSGGASVLGGPGVLMYSVVLPQETAGGIRGIDQAHQHVMSRVREAVRRQQPEVQLQGICDLTWMNRKCSGNSLRIARHHLLYHGTILYSADLEQLAACLTQAPRQPDYRAGRDHHAFVTNIPIGAEQLRGDLESVFQTEGSVTEEEFQQVILPRVERLQKERYDNHSWHYRH